MRWKHVGALDDTIINDELLPRLTELESRSDAAVSPGKSRLPLQGMKAHVLFFAFQRVDEKPLPACFAFEKAAEGDLPSLLVSLLLAAPALRPGRQRPDARCNSSDAAEEARFHALTSELRCVMCQNQSLADSNAQIAHDLRREVLELMREGKSDDEIKRLPGRSATANSCCYKPAMEPATWLLWFGPALLLLGGGFVVVRIVRARAAPRRRACPMTGRSGDDAVRGHCDRC